MSLYDVRWQRHRREASHARSGAARTALSTKWTEEQYFSPVKSLLAKSTITANKWHGHLYHVILTMTDEEVDYTLASRVCKTMDEARRLVKKWQQKYEVGDDDVRDNTFIDLGKLLAGIEPADFSPTNN